MKLWYRQAAKDWSEALPLGNGRIGAMVHHRTVEEKISLNEDTLWSGSPRQDPEIANAPQNLSKVRSLLGDGKYHQAQQHLEETLLGPYTQSYMPLGDFLVSFPDLKQFPPVKQYRRELDLGNAVSTLSFTCKGITYQREVFISAPDQCLVAKFTASAPGAISLQAGFASQLPHMLSGGENTLLISGCCPSHVDPLGHRRAIPVLYLAERPGTRFQGKAVFAIEGGSLRIQNGQMYVCKASTIEIRIFIRSSFGDESEDPEIIERNLHARIAQDVHQVSGKDHQYLKGRHIQDYQLYFNRVSCNISGASQTNESGIANVLNIPTDRRLHRFQDSQDDCRLYELLFHYGRYLLICSSRPGTRPANLQGIWNDSMQPPWASNYTLNINLEMNYWAAEICNLSELHTPLFDLLERMLPNGRECAQKYYGSPEGFVAHHNTDIWANCFPVGEYQGCATYHFWNMGAAWLCRHLFEHYEYSNDYRFLRDRAWPLIRPAAIFCLDILQNDEKQGLCFRPSTSPEHSFYYEGKICGLAQNATMSVAIARDIFTIALECIDLLGAKDELQLKMQHALAQMPEYPVGSKGQVLEWEQEFEEAEPQHRHLSHLYFLHPSSELYTLPRSQRQKLLTACAKTLQYRSDEGTGWALAWRMNMWTRLGDGNHALELLKRQLRLSTPENGIGGSYTNLLCAHPPFQIDGNFGAVAGIAGMFLQSFGHTILLLPALPDEWRTGTIRGFRSTGNLEWQLVFANGLLQSATVTALSDPAQCEREIAKPREFTVSYRGNDIKLSIEPGTTKVISSHAFQASCSS